MEAQTVMWLVFLALIKHVSTIDPSSPFKLEPGVLLATEGSCVEMKCQVKRHVDDRDANWFWMKDILWVDRDYTSTVIYSTNTLTRPVSPDFANRVKYTGSPSSSWQNANSARLKPRCSIWICDLRRSDSGKYSLRFEGTGSWKWSSEEVTLNVEDPPTEPKLSMSSEVTEGQTITINCTAESFPQSTLTLMKINTNNQAEIIPETNINSRPINPVSHTFTVTSADAGRYFCRAQNAEVYKDSMWKKLVVKYPPTEPKLTMSSEVTEGQTIRFTCTAESFPQSTLTLMRIDTNNQSLRITENNLYSRPINSLSHKINVTSADAGQYFCRAQNTEGSKNSKQQELVVKYSPNNVTVQANPGLDVKKNASLTLSCSAESNPPVSSVTWRKTTDGREEIIQQTQTQTFRVNSTSPSDSGLYSCEATNDIGSGKSQPAEVKVRYSPNNVTVQANPGLDVKENVLLTLSCSAESNPPVSSVTWRKTTDGREEIIQQTQTQTFRVNSASPSDSGLYSCEATNDIGSGKSQPAEVKVRYSPNNVTVQANPGLEVNENVSLTLSCSAESNPPVSSVTWRKTTDGREEIIQQTQTQTFRVNSASPSDSGLYSCEATNDIGSGKSQLAEVKVRYSPNNVTVQANPGLDVKENVSLTLSCSAESNPPVSSVTWRKTTDGREEIIQRTQTQTFRVNSASPSDSGLYSCEATNDIGSGKSQLAEVKVRFSPKHTYLAWSAEKQELDGRSSVMLSCFSHSFPPVQHYSWYRKSQGEEQDENVSEHQNHIVYSNQPGVYYCIAQNEVDQSSSDPVHLFERDYLENLRFLVVALLLLMIISVIVVNLRYWRKSIQQGTTNTKSPSGLSNEPESLQDYENISNAAAPTSSNLFDDHTSEGEVELNFPQVRFTATPRRQTTNRDSSSSHQDES
ncbi:B-cell receptor CD22 isoform X2 [Pleuronectes platessa]|uniref:B-cell receptor CD22 isoform X2 n=1 Tax=Pleuronectes platessa TaxID=8262 RepID=UPI00232A1770|nr:B-cell receptor CD22 isoform X2 [Pleuronectes platessa]